MIIRNTLLFILLFGVNCFANTRTFEIVKITDQKNEKIYSHYCIVVGSFSSLPNAQKYGSVAQAKGYEVSYRDNGNGFYRVCLLDFKTEHEAKQRIDELKTTDNLFKQAWVLGLDNASEKIATSIQPVAKPVEKEKASEKVSANTQPIIKSTHKAPDTKTSNIQPTSKPVEKASEKTKWEPVLTNKTNPPVPAPEVTNSTVQQEQKVYSHYCLVVANLATDDDAKEYGSTLRNNGYNVFFRKLDDGTYSVCMYNMSTYSDAEKRLDKMRHIDGIFTKATILGYENARENLSIDQL